jgi:hypothetical protein
MSAKPVLGPSAIDVRLFVGVAALLCGLCAIVGGLRSPDGSPGLDAIDAPPAWSGGVELSALRPLAGPGIDPTVGVAQIMPQMPSVAPAPQRAGERLLSGSAEGLVRSEINAATARWTAAWSATRAGDTLPAYLARSTSPGWSGTITTWEATSGYGAVEASRATIDPGTYHRAELQPIGVPGVEESAFTARDEPQSFLLLNGAWSRERGPSGIRSSTLHWATAVWSGGNPTDGMARSKFLVGTRTTTVRDHG